VYTKTPFSRKLNETSGDYIDLIESSIYGPLIEPISDGPKRIANDTIRYGTIGEFNVDSKADIIFPDSFSSSCPGQSAADISKRAASHGD